MVSIVLKFRLPRNTGLNPALLSNGKLTTQTVLGAFPIFHLDMATAASWGCVTLCSPCPLFNSILLCLGECQASCSLGTGNNLEVHKWFHCHHFECVSRLLAGHPWQGIQALPSCCTITALGALGMGFFIKAKTKFPQINVSMWLPHNTFS